MSKIRIHIDRALLAHAAWALGTRGPRATVQRALEEVIAYRTRVELVHQLTRMEGLDLDKPEVMSEAWR